MTVSGAHLVHILLSSLLEFALYCLVTPGVKYLLQLGPTSHHYTFRAGLSGTGIRKTTEVLELFRKIFLIPSIEMEKVVSVFHLTFLPDLYISSLYFITTMHKDKTGKVGSRLTTEDCFLKSPKAWHQDRNLFRKFYIFYFWNNLRYIKSFIHTYKVFLLDVCVDL